MLQAATGLLDAAGSDRRDRRAPALFGDLVVWERRAEAAAAHFVEGQAVSFSGRLDPREYSTSTGEKRLALEVHDVTIEYGPKPRSAAPDTHTAAAPATHLAEQDIRF
jgi:single-stranded DNA-binding protein